MEHWSCIERSSWQGLKTDGGGGGSSPGWLQHSGPGPWGDGGDILQGRDLRGGAGRETEVPHPPKDQRKLGSAWSPGERLDGEPLRRGDEEAQEQSSTQGSGAE